MALLVFVLDTMLTIKEGFWMSEEEAPGAGWEAGLAKDIGEALATAEGGPVAGAAVGADSGLPRAGRHGSIRRVLGL